MKTAAHILGTLVFSLTLLQPALSRALPAGEDGNRARHAYQLLRQLRLVESQAIIKELRARHDTDGDVASLSAFASFLRGDYAAAVSTFQATIAPDTTTGLVREPVESMARATAAATEGFIERSSDDGRYRVAVTRGRDELMVPFLLEVMKAADEALSADLGHRVPGPLRLELYPTAQALASVSSLEPDEIRRTGTIALCKWDRVMLTSPRALLRGYPWADTVAHEIVHLILTRATYDKAPVWFQEGVAKVLERRWRGDPASAALDPSTQLLLTQARDTDQLIPFERLHPSIARLSSQEEAQLAFAQVSTYFEMVIRDHGIAALQRSLEQLRESTDARDALASATSSNWQSLMAKWHEDLSELTTVERAPTPQPMHFVEDDGDGQHNTPHPPASDSPITGEARRRKRLGDLLLARRRPAAALIEYRSAIRLAPDHLALGIRLGRTALQVSEPEGEITDEVADALEALAVLHPRSSALQTILGETALRRGRGQLARRAFRQAVWINPFDPNPHCRLAELDDGPPQQRAETTCRALR